MAQYEVAAVWWPDGWEPSGPRDVPNCIGWVSETGAAPPMSYEQAVATVEGLNRQSMDHPGSHWHVVASAGEGTADAVERHVVYSEGAGRGDCSHCPARTFPCASDAE
jgi:hypothetical protein